MIAMIIISIIATLANQGFNSIKSNLQHNKTLWVILAMAGYALFSYQYHGLSSRELRALLGASLFLLFFPRQLLTSKFLLGLSLIGAIICISNAFYFSQVANLPRHLWTINAIPQATLSASIGIVALVQLLRCENKKELLVASISLVLSIIAIIFSQTRGIWLGFGVATCLIMLQLFRYRQINWKFVVTGMAIIFAAGFSLKPQLEQRINSTQHEVKQITSGNLNSSIGLRLQMWKLGPHMLNNNVLLGAGDSHSQRFEALYKQGLVSEKLYRFQPAHYHNQYLDRLIKNGIIGLTMLLLVFLVPLAQTRNQPSSKRYMITGLVVLYAIAALTDVPFNHGQTLFMYMLLICGLFAYPSETEES